MAVKNLALDFKYDTVLDSECVLHVVCLLLRNMNIPGVPEVNPLAVSAERVKQVSENDSSFMSSFLNIKVTVQNYLNTCRVELSDIKMLPGVGIIMLKVTDLGDPLNVITAG